jgi:hypothetical protein
VHASLLFDKSSAAAESPVTAREELRQEAAVLLLLVADWFCCMSVALMLKTVRRFNATSIIAIDSRISKCRTDRLMLTTSQVLEQVQHVGSVKLLAPHLLTALLQSIDVQSCDLKQCFVAAAHTLACCLQASHASGAVAAAAVDPNPQPGEPLQTRDTNEP